MYMQYEPRTRFATLHASEQYPKWLQWLRLNRVIHRVEPDSSAWIKWAHLAGAGELGSTGRTRIDWARLNRAGGAGSSGLMLQYPNMEAMSGKIVQNGRRRPDITGGIIESRIWVDTTDSADAMYISSQSAWKRCWISKTSSEKGAGPKRVVNVLDICHITSFEIAPREKIYVKLSTYPEIWPVKIEGAVRGCVDLCLDSLYYIPESPSNEDHR
ncbi:hypothetical protein DFH09DRAFT_1098181 [Mycena vulgaris]|nr:hypothetical protein DFH09DRAFT_1098181 [Mycena vulgaris]